MQTNPPISPIMVDTFGRDVRAEAILFENRFETKLTPEGSGFRATEPKARSSYVVDRVAARMRTLDLLSFLRNLVASRRHRQKAQDLVDNAIALVLLK